MHGLKVSPATIFDLTRRAASSFSCASLHELMLPNSLSARMGSLQDTLNFWRASWLALLLDFPFEFVKIDRLGLFYRVNWGEWGKTRPSQKRVGPAQPSLLQIPGLAGTYKEPSRAGRKCSFIRSSQACPAAQSSSSAHRCGRADGGRQCRSPSPSPWPHLPAWQRRA
jgi:hypothetical protein